MFENLNVQQSAENIICADLKSSMSQPQRHRRILRDSISGLTSSAVKRISLKTGKIGSREQAVIYGIRDQSEKFLRAIISDAIIMMEHARKKTVSEEMVRSAIERRTNLFSKKILGSAPSKRCETYGTHLKSQSRSRGKSGSRRKSSRGSSLIRQIKFYQRQHDCLHLPKLVVSRIIREIGQDFKNDVRWSSKAESLLQYALELHIEAIFRVSGHIALHCDRKGRLAAKDVQAALAIEKLLAEL